MPLGPKPTLWSPARSPRDISNSRGRDRCTFTQRIAFSAHVVSPRARMRDGRSSAKAGATRPAVAKNKTAPGILGAGGERWSRFGRTHGHAPLLSSFRSSEQCRGTTEWRGMRVSESKGAAEATPAGYNVVRDEMPAPARTFLKVSFCRVDSGELPFVSLP